MFDKVLYMYVGLICIHGDFLPLTLSNHVTKPLRTASKDLLSWWQTHPNNPQGVRTYPSADFGALQAKQTAKASASLELRYFANDDDERYSIQARNHGGEEICLGTWGEQRSGEMIWSPLEVVFFKNGRFLIFITKVCSKVLWWCIYWLRYEHFLPGFQWPVRSLTFLPNLHFPFLSSNSHSIFPWFKHYNPCIWYISQDLP